MAKLTPEVVSKLKEAFAMDCTVTEACLFAGISRTAYYDWINANPELADRFEQLRETPVLKARSTIVKSLDNVGTSQWYIERKRPNVFAMRTEHPGGDGQPQDLAADARQIIGRK